MQKLQEAWLAKNSAYWWSESTWTGNCFLRAAALALNRSSTNRTSAFKNLFCWLQWFYTACSSDKKIHVHSIAPWFSNTEKKCFYLLNICFLFHKVELLCVFSLKIILHEAYSCESVFHLLNVHLIVFFKIIKNIYIFRNGK